MNQKTRQKLTDAKSICDAEDRSTEYMIQFMQDHAHCSFDTVMEFLMEEGDGKEI